MKTFIAAGIRTDKGQIQVLIEHGFTSAPTQYMLYGRQFLQVWWPNQQCQSTEGGWLVIQRGLSNSNTSSTMTQRSDKRNICSNQQTR